MSDQAVTVQQFTDKFLASQGAKSFFFFLICAQHLDLVGNKKPHCWGVIGGSPQATFHAQEKTPVASLAGVLEYEKWF